MVVFHVSQVELTNSRFESEKVNSYVSILASILELSFSYCLPVPSNKSLDAISSQVAILLKEEREKRGLSLNVLAQKAGLSRQSVSYIEQEVQNPTLDTLLRLTSAMEIELADIIKRAGKKASAQRGK